MAVLEGSVRVLFWCKFLPEFLWNLLLLPTQSLSIRRLAENDSVRRFAFGRRAERHFLWSVTAATTVELGIAPYTGGPYSVHRAPEGAHSVTGAPQPCSFIFIPHGPVLEPGSIAYTGVPGLAQLKSCLYAQAEPGCILKTAEIWRLSQIEKYCLMNREYIRLD